MLCIFNMYNIDSNTIPLHPKLYVITIMRWMKILIVFFTQ